MNIKSELQSINRRTLTNNTQKVAFRLLGANGEWVSRRDLERNISSAAARVRDLRKSQFGGFNVECASASELNRRGEKGSYFYRITPASVKRAQIKTVFRV